jgi:tRNA pseudouridine38-40 synthase
MGTGKKDPKDMKTIIEGLDRAKAGHTAPAEGLYLKEIYF